MPPALALTYALAVVIAAWHAPDKGFAAFTGQRVVFVEEGGRADRGGLHEGDVIVEADGAKVTGTLDYAFRVLSRSEGETVRLGVARIVEHVNGAGLTISTRSGSTGRCDLRARVHRRAVVDEVDHPPHVHQQAAAPRTALMAHVRSVVGLAATFRRAVIPGVNRCSVAQRESRAAQRESRTAQRESAARRSANPHRS